MKDIEDFFPLSPMQQGMLFHTLYEPEAEAYFEQLSFAVRGGFDTRAFERAWEQVVSRHQALRSSFRWEGLKEPVQVIHRQAKPEVERHDWRNAPADERTARLEELLRADRQRGFNLSLAPLMRLIIVRMKEDEYQVVWSHHHLLMDGWSVPIIFNEVVAYYTAYNQGRELQLDVPRPYRDYIAWLKRQDMKRAQAFWREQLRGFTAPTPLGEGQPPEDET
ncbi:MAG: condensation domain-containing protein, partial [Pyrinomonadaceae bacterium]